MSKTNTTHTEQERQKSGEEEGVMEIQRSIIEVGTDEEWLKMMGLKISRTYVCVAHRFVRTTQ